MTLPLGPEVLGLSGERFRVVYHLFGVESLAEAQAKAQDICLEQTVEFPDDLVPDGDIREKIVGRIENLSPLGPGHYEALISYADETAGRELPQLLNVIFGNISLKPGIRVFHLDLSPSLLAQYQGPRFGLIGWRNLLGVHDRPLLMTALKPMGLPVKDLAKLAYEFALGGLDIIKDDHGLANQPFGAYQERVIACTEAVAQANAQTGLRCQYMPNITAPASEVMARAQFAKQNGAGALLICPGLTGFDVMREVSADNNIALPIASHPSFYGSLVTSPQNGFSHRALYGQWQRLCGADASIYPNFGGRFAFSQAECESIVGGCMEPMGEFKPIFPTPGGGMSLESLPALRGVYGQEVIYLIGGGLHRHSSDLIANVRHFLQLVRG